MRSRSLLVASVALLALVGGTATAHAAVERFAFLFASNQGADDEPPLRFAESDAAKLRDVLVELGDFHPENVVVLPAARADGVRRALITVNDRVRSLPAGTEAVLLVYFSGHADASALHLGGTLLELLELERLVRGSAATVRLLVLDACRSGSLTRVKGARAVPPFAIDVDEALASEGAVFLTSSSAGEDAQESDELRGSFFTHYLVSGLLGAADSNGDGRVALSEAYRHAYEATLRATSRTLAGAQHPTYRFSLAGRGDVVLTRLRGDAGQRAWLRFPPGRGYLVLRDDADGAVVGEVGVRDRRRRLSVHPGRYFVRGRGPRDLLEGAVVATAGAEREVGDAGLERFEYARLVRKGAGVLDRLHGPQLGARLHGPVAAMERPCAGGFLGYLVEKAEVDLGLRAGWCRSGQGGDPTVADAFDLELMVRKIGDAGRVSFGPVATLGVGVLRQRFAPGRAGAIEAALMGRFGIGFALGVELGGGAIATLDALVDGYGFRPWDELDELAAFRLQLAVGWRP